MTKFAHIIVAVMSAECYLTSAAFAFSGQYRLAVYWFLVACINAVAGTF